jgi:predicted tellurium resistance membrane protein TerC
MKKLIEAVVAVANLAAAILFIIASQISVRDSLDDLVGDLQSVARWTGYGAAAVGIGALAAFLVWAWPQKG